MDVWPFFKIMHEVFHEDYQNVKLFFRLSPYLTILTIPFACMICKDNISFHHSAHVACV